MRAGGDEGEAWTTHALRAGGDEDGRIQNCKSKICYKEI